MDKLYFVELADFNLWATERVCSWLEKLLSEQWTQSLVSSFGSIEETVLHMVSAEYAWVQRLTGQEKVVQLQKDFRGTTTELMKIWKRSSRLFTEFMAGFDQARLRDDFYYRRFNGDPFCCTFYQVFTQVVNHGTYHRGQVVTLLRQAGFTELQPTDLMVYYTLRRSDR